MPHLLILMLALMVVMSLLTYILPAGEFVTDANGVNSYVSVARTPVSILDALMLIYDGIINSAMIMTLLLVMGACIAVILGTQAIDRVIDCCLYKLQNRGIVVLIPVMFILMALLGGFNGSDALIAVIPIGVMFAKKLRVDPIAAAGVTLLATMIGFGTSPTGIFLAQMLMGVPLLSGFGCRIINLGICAVIGAVYVTVYALRVSRNPAKSAMGDGAWMAELEGDAGHLEEKKLDIRDLLIVILFVAQFVAIIVLTNVFSLSYSVMIAIQIPVALVCGLLGRMKLNQIGMVFEKGAQGMAFICLIIGFAGTLSLIMKNGNILATIAYYASLPLQGLSAGVASVGLSLIIMVLNFVVPSASAKAAVLIPIMQPMAVNLGIDLQTAVQSFQIGDGLTNIISPFLGWTIGGLTMAKVPYQKWVKWVLPLLGILLVVEYVFLMVVNAVGWF